MPVCSRCYEELPVHRFFRDPSRGQKRQSYCKACANRRRDVRRKRANLRRLLDEARQFLAALPKSTTP
jgi:hypothetical protein